MIDGRCATCRHWREDTYLADIYNGPIGECRKGEDDDKYSPEKLVIAQSMEGDGWLNTRPDFGCVLWEGEA